MFRNKDIVKSNNFKMLQSSDDVLLKLIRIYTSVILRKEKGKQKGNTMSLMSENKFDECFKLRFFTSCAEA